MPKTTSPWKDRAAQALANGHHRGGPWEGMLDRALRANKPQLVKEFGKEYQDYLFVQASKAKDRFVTLVGQGDDPKAAQDLAIEELLAPARNV